MAIRIGTTRLVYFPVPKVACTSVKEAILAISDPAKFAALKENPGRFKRGVHSIYGTRPLGLSDRYLRRMADLRFCIVRDPLRRFVSGYRNRIIHHRDLEGANLRGLPSIPSIDQFAMNLDRYCRLSGPTNHHFAHQIRYLGDRSDFFDQVFDLSQLDEMLEYLAANGAKLDLPHAQRGGPSMSTEDLSAEASHAVKEFYAKDYETYGKWFR